MNGMAAALALLPTFGAAIGMGFATSKAVEATARQPEASGKINSILLLGLALTESTAIYGFVTALLLIFV
ncbi:MAG: ATP synthase F0 subunit C [Clostridia bacterium]|nr:ATP synthase F0 subunit C [Clostridia bacterium]